VSGGEERKHTLEGSCSPENWRPIRTRTFRRNQNVLFIGMLNNWQEYLSVAMVKSNGLGS